MSLLNPISAPERQFRRPTETPYGESAFTSLGGIASVVSLGAESAKSSSVLSQRSAYQIAGIVFTPRGAGVKEGDRFTYNEVEYALVGPALGDQDQPFTGDDFGWVEHAIERSS